MTTRKKHEFQHFPAVPAVASLVAFGMSVYCLNAAAAECGTHAGTWILPVLCTVLGGLTPLSVALGAGTVRCQLAAAIFGAAAVIAMSAFRVAIGCMMTILELVITICVFGVYGVASVRVHQALSQARAAQVSKKAQ